MKLLLCFHIFIWFFLQDLIVFMNQFVKASFLYLKASFRIFVFSQEFLMVFMLLFFRHQSLVDVHWSNSTYWSCWCCACCMLILKLFGHFDLLAVNSSGCQNLASFLGCSSLTLQNLQVLSLLFCQAHLVFQSIWAFCIPFVNLQYFHDIIIVFALCIKSLDFR